MRASSPSTARRSWRSASWPGVSRATALSFAERTFRGAGGRAPCGARLRSARRTRARRDHGKRDPGRRNGHAAPDSPFREFIEVAKKRNPHHRLTTPEDVARCLVALCHQAMYWMTGNTLRVDGGESIVG
ncbi:MAG TPA: SDR family oxidoreductase [Thermoanaerobaculia bacterium]|nr:SDR family oxidoreductase [Thermoanaerobaculia bacterium]